MAWEAGQVSWSLWGSSEGCRGQVGTPELLNLAASLCLQLPEVALVCGCRLILVSALEILPLNRRGLVRSPLQTPQTVLLCLSYSLPFGKPDELNTFCIECEIPTARVRSNPNK